MKTLASLIQEKSDQMELQIVRAEPKTPNEVAWLRCKKKVLGLTADFENATKTAIEKDPIKVKRRYIKGGYSISVLMMIEGFECELHLLENDTQGVVSAEYIAWNDDFNTCYIRDLLSNDLLMLPTPNVGTKLLS